MDSTSLLGSLVFLFLTGVAPLPISEKGTVHKITPCKNCDHHVGNPFDILPSVSDSQKGVVPADDNFDLAGDHSKTIQRKIDTFDIGKYSTVCWTEITTSIQDPKTNEVIDAFKEYAISFDTPAEIPSDVIAPGSGTSGKYVDTKQSKKVPFEVVHQTDSVIVKQKKEVKCGSGPLYTREILEWPSKNRKRLQIKVSPKDVQKEIEECERAREAEAPPSPTLSPDAPLLADKVSTRLQPSNQTASPESTTQEPFEKGVAAETMNPDMGEGPEIIPHLNNESPTTHILQPKESHPDEVTRVYLKESEEERITPKSLEYDQPETEENVRGPSEELVTTIIPDNIIKYGIKTTPTAITTRLHEQLSNEQEYQKPLHTTSTMSPKDETNQLINHINGLIKQELNPEAPEGVHHPTVSSPPTSAEESQLPISNRAPEGVHHSTISSPPTSAEESQLPISDQAPEGVHRPTINSPPTSAEESQTPPSIASRITHDENILETSATTPIPGEEILSRKSQPANINDLRNIVSTVPSLPVEFDEDDIDSESCDDLEDYSLPSDDLAAKVIESLSHQDPSGSFLKKISSKENPERQKMITDMANKVLKDIMASKEGPSSSMELSSEELFTLGPFSDKKHRTRIPTPGPDYIEIDKRPAPGRNIDDKTTTRLNVDEDSPEHHKTEAPVAPHHFDEENLPPKRKTKLPMGSSEELSPVAIDDMNLMLHELPGTRRTNTEPNYYGSSESLSPQDVSSGKMNSPEIYSDSGSLSSDSYEKPLKHRESTTTYPHKESDDYIEDWMKEAPREPPGEPHHIFVPTRAPDTRPTYKVSTEMMMHSTPPDVQARYSDKESEEPRHTKTTWRFVEPTTESQYFKDDLQQPKTWKSITRIPGDEIEELRYPKTSWRPTTINPELLETSWRARATTPNEFDIPKTAWRSGTTTSDESESPQTSWRSKSPSQEETMPNERFTDYQVTAQYPRSTTDSSFYYIDKMTTHSPRKRPINIADQIFMPTTMNPLYGDHISTRMLSGEYSSCSEKDGPCVASASASVGTNGKINPLAFPTSSQFPIPLIAKTIQNNKVYCYKVGEQVQWTPCPENTNSLPFLDDGMVTQVPENSEERERKERLDQLLKLICTKKLDRLRNRLSDPTTRRSLQGHRINNNNPKESAQFTFPLNSSLDERKNSYHRKK